jgi:hypothetical protein
MQFNFLSFFIEIELIFVKIVKGLGVSLNGHNGNWEIVW